MSDFPRSQGLPQTLADIERRLYALERAASSIDTGWLDPVLINSWDTVAEPFMAKYRRLNRFTVMRGFFRATVLGSTSPCNLPAGFRPSYNVTKIIYCSDGTHRRVRVEPDGDVLLLDGVGAIPGAAYLDIEFPALL